MSDEPSTVSVNLVAAPVEAPAQEPPPQASPTPAPQPTPEPTPEPTPNRTPEPLPSEPVPEAPKPTPLPIPHAQEKPAAAVPLPKPRRENLSGANPRGSATSGPTVGTRARYRSNPRPDYPADARRNHQEGVVLLSVEVGADGQPKEVALKRTSGFALLDQAAIQAVRRWAFEPAVAAGFPVASRVDVPVRFSLAQP